MKDINSYKNYRTKYKKYYGIDFDKSYAVHHIDGNRENNDIDNLLLLPNNLHSQYHARRYLVEFFCNGKIDLGLSYASLCKRGQDLLFLDDFIKVAEQISYWIEQKHLADQGYNHAYRDFKGEKNGRI